VGGICVGYGMNSTDSRVVIRRQCICCGKMFEPVDSWVCPACERARDRQMVLDQSRLPV
jgi:rRNA maturation endonuclease Nob1